MILVMADKGEPPGLIFQLFDISERIASFLLFNWLIDVLFLHSRG